MSRVSPCCLLWLLLLAGCTSGPAACGLGHVATLPFSYRYGHHMMVNGTINDGPVSLIFDTGSSTSILTPQTAERLDLLEAGEFGVSSGIGGSRVASLVTAYNLRLGTLHGETFRFLEANVLEHVPHADGLLSTDFLSKYDFDLDLDHRKIELYLPQGDCRHPTVAMSGEVTVVPFDEAEPGSERVFVRVEIGGHPFRALVDTGASTVLFRPAARALGLRLPRAGSNTPVMFAHGIGPDAVAASRRTLPPMRIGDLEVQNWPAAVLDEDSPDDTDLLLGVDFLRMFHAWISYSSHTLVLQDPPATPAPAPAAQPPREVHRPQVDERG